MPAPTQRQFLTGASTRDPFLAKPAHLGPEVSGDRSLPSYTTLSRAMVQLGRGRRAGSRTACRDGGRGRRMPVRERVRSMARYAAGCSGAAGDTSCELRPWSTSESRSNSLGQTIVRSSGSTRTWRKTAGRKAARSSDPHIGGEVDDSFAAVIKDQAEFVAVKGLDGGYGDHATDARPAG
jgi:hypothetical protein